MEGVFWVSVALIVHSYFFYPLLLRLFTKPHKVPTSTHNPLPRVDVIVAAYNEESCIYDRIQNVLAQDYPGKVQVLVASDGSQDNTGQIIQSFDDPRVIAFNFEQNRGKISVLNDLVQHSEADILVFTDANTQFDSDAISTLVSSFEEEVGAVSGELNLFNANGTQNKDNLYWQYEKILKKHESSIGGLLGANGAIYAIRRELYVPLPKDTVVDDFCIVMNVKRQSFKVIYNDNARANEEIAPTLSEEYNRRVRIGIGNYKAFRQNLWALSPIQGWFSFCYWSHKVLRWFAPHLMLIAFVTNAFLLDQFVYQVLFSGQILFYLVGLYGKNQINKSKSVNPLVAVVSFFVSMNMALAHGFIKYIKGHHSGGWKTTLRQGDSE